MIPPHWTPFFSWTWICRIWNRGLITSDNRMWYSEIEHSIPVYVTKYTIILCWSTIHKVEHSKISHMLEHKTEDTTLQNKPYMLEHSTEDTTVQNKPYMHNTEDTTICWSTIQKIQQSKISHICWSTIQKIQLYVGAQYRRYNYMLEHNTEDRALQNKPYVGAQYRRYNTPK